MFYLIANSDGDLKEDNGIEFEFIWWNNGKNDNCTNTYTNGYYDDNQSKLVIIISVTENKISLKYGSYFDFSNDTSYVTLVGGQWNLCCVNTLQCHHNEHNGISNHRSLHLLVNCWFKHRS